MATATISLTATIDGAANTTVTKSATIDDAVMSYFFNFYRTVYGQVDSAQDTSVLLASTTMTGGGNSYQDGDVLLVSGGTFTTQAEITVDTVDGSGVILTFHVSTGGIYTTIPNNPASVSGGNGTGATFTLDWGDSPPIMRDMTDAETFAAYAAGISAGTVANVQNYVREMATQQAAAAVPTIVAVPNP